MKHIAFDLQHTTINKTSTTTTIKRSFSNYHFPLQKNDKPSTMENQQHENGKLHIVAEMTK